MKNVKRLAMVSLLGLAICGFAIAQSHLGAIQHEYKDAASAAKHLSEAFTDGRRHTGAGEIDVTL
jgi:hypothetical protein